MALCPSNADRLFGPRVAPACRSFDFTLVFEETFFSIAPAALFLLALPWRLYQLYHRPRLARDSLLHWLKLVVVSIYLIANIVLILLMSTAPISTATTTTTILATTLNLVVAICILPLSHLEHVRTVRPSALLSTYLVLTLLLSLAQSRTYWLLSNQWTGFAACYTATVAIKALVLVTESWDKTKLLPVKYQLTSPEERAGILSRTVFAWLNAIFIKGYRRRFGFDDLYPVDAALSSRTLAERLRNAWKTGDHGGSYDLALTLFKCLIGSLLLPIVPRLCLIAFKFSQPFLVERVTDYLAQAPAVNAAADGYGLIGAYALVYTGLAISRGVYWHLQYRFITMSRGALVTTIYRKTLSVDMSLVAGSQATTLMSADIEQIAVGFQWIHELWANSVEVGLGLWLLYQQIGLSSLAAAVVALLCAICASFVARVAASRQMVWLSAMQQRLHETSRFLKSTKSIKMLGLESKVLETIGRLREIELGKAMYWWVATCLSLALGFLPQLVGPPVVFGIFVFTQEKGATELDTTRLFGSIAILALVTTPLNLLFQSLPTVGSAFNCLSRIQTYLRLDDVRDPRNAIDLDVASTSVSSKACTAPAFTISNGSFAWKAGSDPALQDIDCSIPAGKLTLLIGPVGCGKSTLLNALLGEIVQLRGETRCKPSRVAMCSQNPWLTNSTIRSTVISTSEEDEEWYKTVLRACDIAEDVESMALGDQTIVGSSGTTLSGGQKQRLTLARAIYSRAPVLLLDDIFSGLDRRTEERILQNLFGLEGILRKMLKSTVVLVSHAERHLKIADHVVALYAGGKGCRQGPSNQFLGQTGMSVAADQPNETGKQEPAQDFISTILNKQPPRLPKPQPPEVQNAVEKTVALSDRQVFLYYMRAVSLPQFALLTLEVGVAGFLERFPTYWAQVWGEANDNSPATANNNYYWAIFTLLQLLALADIYWAVWHLFMYVIPKSGSRLHARLLGAVLGASHSVLSRMDTGSLTNRFSQDLLLIDTQLPISLLNFGFYLATALAGFGLITAASLLILAAGPFLVFVLFAIQRFYLRTSKNMRLFDLQAKAPLYSQFTDALSGLATIRAFGWTAEFEAENDLLLDTSQRPFYLMYCIQRWLTCVLDLVVAGLAVVVMGLAVAYRQKGNASSVGVALINLISLGSTLESVVTEYTQLETSIGAVARIQDFVAQTPQESNASVADPATINRDDKGGTVEFRDVSATYGSNANKVLDGLSLQIRPGEKVAICGRSGSGKSTLLQVLLRMLDVSDGTVLVREADSTNDPPRIQRERFNTIPQEPYFFHGSFRENLARGTETSDVRILEVLDRVGLMEKINNLDGLDADCSSDTFSSGELQLLSLARAILHPRGILLLDEATGNVDNETDTKMHDIIWDEFSNNTIIAVMHRQEMLHRFDRIIVLDQGKIVFQARPEELRLARN